MYSLNATKRERKSHDHNTAIYRGNLSRDINTTNTQTTPEHLSFPLLYINDTLKLNRHHRNLILKLCLFRDLRFIVIRFREISRLRLRSAHSVQTKCDIDQ